MNTKLFFKKIKQIKQRIQMSFNIFNPKNIFQMNTNIPNTIINTNNNIFDMFNLELVETHIPEIKIIKDSSRLLSTCNIQKTSDKNIEYDKKTLPIVINVIEEKNFDNINYTMNEIKNFIIELKNEYNLRNLNINRSKKCLLNMIKDISENPQTYFPKWKMIGSERVDVNKIKEKVDYKVDQLKKIVKEIYRIENNTDKLPNKKEELLSIISHYI